MGSLSREATTIHINGIGGLWVANMINLNCNDVTIYNIYLYLYLYVFDIYISITLFYYIFLISFSCFTSSRRMMMKNPASSAGFRSCFIYFLLTRSELYVGEQTHMFKLHIFGVRPFHLHLQSFLCISIPWFIFELLQFATV